MTMKYFWVVLAGLSLSMNGLANANPQGGVVVPGGYVVIECDP